LEVKFWDVEHALEMVKQENLRRSTRNFKSTSKSNALEMRNRRILFESPSIQEEDIIQNLKLKSPYIKRHFKILEPQIKTQIKDSYSKIILFEQSAREKKYQWD